MKRFPGNAAGYRKTLCECAMWIELINTTFLSTSGSIGCTILQVGHFSSSHTMHDLFGLCSGCSELLSAKFPLVSICSSHLQHCLAHFCRPQNPSKFCFFFFHKSFAGIPRNFCGRVLCLMGFQGCLLFVFLLCYKYSFGKQ